MPLERHVDDVLDEPVGQWRVAVQQPVTKRAVAEVGRYLDVRAGLDFAAGDSAVKMARARSRRGSTTSLAVLGRECRVTVRQQHRLYYCCC
jgi:hypothetical protein